MTHSIDFKKDVFFESIGRINNHAIAPRIIISRRRNHSELDAPVQVKVISAMMFHVLWPMNALCPLLITTSVSRTIASL